MNIGGLYLTFVFDSRSGSVVAWIDNRFIPWVNFQVKKERGIIIDTFTSRPIPLFMSQHRDDMHRQELSGMVGLGSQTDHT